MRRFVTVLLRLALTALAMTPTPQSAAQEYTFFTLAGPSESPGAVDGTGNAARFHKPSALVVDSAGNVYVADTGNHAIRKVTPCGVVTTLAGDASTVDEGGSPMGDYSDGTGGAVHFSGPSGVVVDRAGNVYVSDTDNHTIRKVTPRGVVTTLAGDASIVDEWGSPMGDYSDGTGSAAHFNGPSGLAVDSTGNLYVADRENFRIRKITPGGEVTTLAGQSGGAVYFNCPSAVAADNEGNLYVAVRDDATIQKVTPGGVVTTLAGLAGSPGNADGMGSAARFNAPHGAAVDNAGNVYVADCGNSTIRKVTPSGVVTTWAGLAGSSGSADGTGSTARFNSPQGLAVDEAGNLYVADTGNSSIRMVSPAGEVTTLAGPSSNPAEFELAAGVAVGREGNIYVVDHERHTIQKIAPGGVVTAFAGQPGESGSSDGTGSAARFCGPAGLAADTAGNLYVADTCNSTIRKISSAGEVTTLAGKAGAFGSADGIGGAARFSAPEGVAVDDAGNVYVSDTGNHTIRKVTPNGAVTTLAGMAGEAGSDDGSGSAARFGAPCGLAVDGSGCVYVADVANHVIRKVSPAGVVTTLAGNATQINEWGGVEGGYADGTGVAARFNWPYGVAVDQTGNLYVTDGRNHCIRKVTPAGTVTTLAGRPGAEGNASGTGSAVRFTLYKHGLGWIVRDCVWAGVAVDASGIVYVADSGGGAFRPGGALPSAIRIGFKAGADRPMLDLPFAHVGVTRQLDVAPQTATAWQWSWLRRPAASQAEPSSTVVANPTITPDVPDLYVLRLMATNDVTGTVSLRTLELTAVPADVAILVSPQRLPDGSFQLTLVGHTNHTYTLEVSTDLSTWTVWTNVAPADCRTLLVDSMTAGHPQRFYRAVSPRSGPWTPEPSTQPLQP